MGVGNRSGSSCNFYNYICNNVGDWLMNRKGISKTVVATIIVVMASVVALVLFFYFKTDAIDYFYDKCCSVGCGLQDKFEVLGVALVGETCVSQHKDVIPDEWARCNTTFKEKDDAQGCLADQIAEIVRTCWVKRGAGELSCGNLKCYTVDVHNLKAGLPAGKDISIDSKYLNEFMKVNSPAFREETYMSFLSPGVYFNGEITPGELWVVDYEEDYDFLIFGLDFAKKDAVALRQEAKLSEK